MKMKVLQRMMLKLSLLLFAVGLTEPIELPSICGVRPGVFAESRVAKPHWCDSHVPGSFLQVVSTFGKLPVNLSSESGTSEALGLDHDANQSLSQRGLSCEATDKQDNQSISRWGLIATIFLLMVTTAVYMEERDRKRKKEIERQQQAEQDVQQEHDYFIQNVGGYDVDPVLEMGKKWHKRRSEQWRWRYQRFWEYAVDLQGVLHDIDDWIDFGVAPEEQEEFTALVQDSEKGLCEFTNFVNLIHEAVQEEWEAKVIQSWLSALPARVRSELNFIAERGRWIQTQQQPLLPTPQTRHYHPFILVSLISQVNALMVERRLVPYGYVFDEAPQNLGFLGNTSFTTPLTEKLIEGLNSMRRSVQVNFEGRAVELALTFLIVLVMCLTLLLLVRLLLGNLVKIGLVICSIFAVYGLSQVPTVRILQSRGMERELAALNASISLFTKVGLKEETSWKVNLMIMILVGLAVITVFSLLWIAVRHEDLVVNTVCLSGWCWLAFWMVKRRMTRIILLCTYLKLLHISIKHPRSMKWVSAVIFLVQVWIGDKKESVGQTQETSYMYYYPNSFHWYVIATMGLVVTYDLTKQRWRIPLDVLNCLAALGEIGFLKFHIDNKLLAKVFEGVTVVPANWFARLWKAIRYGEPADSVIFGILGAWIKMRVPSCHILSLVANLLGINFLEFVPLAERAGNLVKEWKKTLKYNKKFSKLIGNQDEDLERLAVDLLLRNPEPDDDALNNATSDNSTKEKLRAKIKEVKTKTTVAKTMIGRLDINDALNMIQRGDINEHVLLTVEQGVEVWHNSNEALNNLDMGYVDGKNRPYMFSTTQEGVSFCVLAFGQGGTPNGRRANKVMHNYLKNHKIEKSMKGLVFSPPHYRCNNIPFNGSSVITSAVISSSLHNNEFESRKFLTQPKDEDTEKKAPEAGKGEEENQQAVTAPPIPPQSTPQFTGCRWQVAGPYKLLVMTNAGRGDCFYYSVADQVGETHDRVRKRYADYLRANGRMSYAEYVSHGRVGINEEEFVDVANIYGRDIACFTERGLSKVIEVGTSLPPILIYLTPGHAESVKIVRGSSPLAFLQQLKMYLEDEETRAQLLLQCTYFVMKHTSGFLKICTYLLCHPLAYYVVTKWWEALKKSEQEDEVETNEDEHKVEQEDAEELAELVKRAESSLKRLKRLERHKKKLEERECREQAADLPRTVYVQEMPTKVPDEIELELDSDPEFDPHSIPDLPQLSLAMADELTFDAQQLNDVKALSTRKGLNIPYTVAAFLACGRDYEDTVAYLDVQVTKHQVAPHMVDPEFTDGNTRALMAKSERRARQNADNLADSNESESVSEADMRKRASKRSRNTYATLLKDGTQDGKPYEEVHRLEENNHVIMLFDAIVENGALVGLLVDHFEFTLRLIVRVVDFLCPGFLGPLAPFMLSGEATKVVTKIIISTCYTLEQKPSAQESLIKLIMPKILISAKLGNLRVKRTGRNDDHQDECADVRNQLHRHTTDINYDLVEIELKAFTTVGFLSFFIPRWMWDELQLRVSASGDNFDAVYMALRHNARTTNMNSAELTRLYKNRRNIKAIFMNIHFGKMSWLGRECLGDENQVFELVKVPGTRDPFIGGILKEPVTVNRQMPRSKISFHGHEPTGVESAKAYRVFDDQTGENFFDLKHVEDQANSYVQRLLKDNTTLLTPRAYSEIAERFGVDQVTAICVRTSNGTVFVEGDDELVGKIESGGFLSADARTRLAILVLEKLVGRLKNSFSVNESLIVEDVDWTIRHAYMTCCVVRGFPMALYDEMYKRLRQKTRKLAYKAMESKDDVEEKYRSQGVVDDTHDSLVRLVELQKWRTVNKKSALDFLRDNTIDFKLKDSTYTTFPKNEFEGSRAKTLRTILNPSNRMKISNLYCLHVANDCLFGLQELFPKHLDPQTKMEFIRSKYEGCTSFKTTDHSKFEASMRNIVADSCELEFFKFFCDGKHYRWLVSTYTPTIKLTTSRFGGKRTLTAVIPNLRRSGDYQTSMGNGITNCATAWVVLDLLGYKEGQVETIFEGDDGLIGLRKEDPSFDKWYGLLMAFFGFDTTLNSYDNVAEAGFCHLHWLESDDGQLVRFRYDSEWVPKLSHFPMNPLFKETDAFANRAGAYFCEFPANPVLAAIVKALGRKTVTLVDNTYNRERLLRNQFSFNTARGRLVVSLPEPDKEHFELVRSNTPLGEYYSEAISWIKPGNARSCIHAVKFLGDVLCGRIRGSSEVAGIGVTGLALQASPHSPHPTPKRAEKKEMPAKVTKVTETVVNKPNPMRQRRAAQRQQRRREARRKQQFEQVFTTTYSTPQRPQRPRRRRQRRNCNRRFSKKSDQATLHFSQFLDAVYCGKSDNEGIKYYFHVINPLIWKGTQAAVVAGAYKLWWVDNLRIKYQASAAATTNGTLRWGFFTSTNLNVSPAALESAVGAGTTRLNVHASNNVPITSLQNVRKYPMGDPAACPVLVIMAQGDPEAFCGTFSLSGTLHFYDPMVTYLQYSSISTSLTELLSTYETTGVVPSMAYISDPSTAVVMSNKARVYNNTFRMRGATNGFFSRLLDLGKKVLFNVANTGITTIIDGIGHVITGNDLNALKAALSDEGVEDVEVTAVVATPYDADQDNSTTAATISFSSTGKAVDLATVFSFEACTAGDLAVFSNNNYLYLWIAPSDGYIVTDVPYIHYKYGTVVTGSSMELNAGRCYRLGLLSNADFSGTTLPSKFSSWTISELPVHKIASDVALYGPSMCFRMPKDVLASYSELLPMRFAISIDSTHQYLDLVQPPTSSGGWEYFINNVTGTSSEAPDSYYAPIFTVAAGNNDYSNWPSVTGYLGHAYSDSDSSESELGDNARGFLYPSGNGEDFEFYVTNLTFESDGNSNNIMLEAPGDGWLEGTGQSESPSFTLGVDSVDPTMLIGIIPDLNPIIVPTGAYFTNILSGPPKVEVSGSPTIELKMGSNYQSYMLIPKEDVDPSVFPGGVLPSATISRPSK